MEKLQRFLVKYLRKGLRDVMERDVKATRKRKLSKGSEDVLIVETHGSKKHRKTSAEKTEKTGNKKTRKEEETENNGLNVKSILSLDQSIQGSSCLLFMKRNQALAIRGKVSMKLLQGAVDVMGYKMNTGQQTCLFSPNFLSLLTLKECRKHEDAATIQSLVKDLVAGHGQHAKKTVTARAQKASSVILMSKMESVETDFVCQFKEYKDCFTVKESDTDVSLNEVENQICEVTSPLGFMLVETKSDRHSFYKEPNEWIDVMNSIMKSPTTPSTDSEYRCQCILVCGGKGVGKSSFARYVINNLMNSFSEVFYLECDVGQTEFTPPAILSLNHVTTPILGPPFTHLRWPERAHFFGDVSPKDNPNLYINTINHLYQYYKENYGDKNLPLVVNTQGWVKGMGVSLLLDIMHITQPTHIIQINSLTQSNKNLPTITRDFLDTTPGWVFPECMTSKGQAGRALVDDLVSDLSRSDNKDISLSTAASLLSPDSHQPVHHPNIFHLTTCSEDHYGVRAKFTASDHRSMDLLAYFSQVQGSCTSSNMPLMECKPYKVSWSNLAVHVMHTEVPRSQVLVSLNASVVGLAVSPDTAIFESQESNRDFPKFLKYTPIVECIGLGIVRNIDPINKLFYILTPVPLDQLKQVNILLKGNLEIPAPLLSKARRPGAPYVSFEFSYDIKGAGAKKVRYNLQRKQLNSPARTKTEK